MKTLYNKSIVIFCIIVIFSSLLGDTQEQEKNAEQKETVLERIPLKTLHEPQAKADINKQDSTSSTKSAMHKPMSTWLIESSIKNAPLLFKGIYNYLSLQNRYNIIPSFHRCILVGPPGCGKTTLARALAYSIKADLHFIPATSFLGRWRNETALNIRKFFEEFFTLPSSEKSYPVVIVIDELHKLFEGYEEDHCDKSETAAAFWLILDTLEIRNPNIIVIGTANNVAKLPPEIKSRFHGKIITMPLPSKHQKIKAFKDILARDSSIEIDKSINKAFINRIVTQLQEGSIRDIQLIIDTAKIFQYAQTKNIDNLSIPLHRVHFEQALRQLNAETIEHKESFIKRIYPTLKPYGLILSFAINLFTITHYCKNLVKDIGNCFA